VLPEIYLAGCQVFSRMDDTPVIDAMLCWIGWVYLAAGTQTSEDAANTFIAASLTNIRRRTRSVRPTSTNRCAEHRRATLRGHVRSTPAAQATGEVGHPDGIGWPSAFLNPQPQL
jgi:hypothetical protein